MTHDEMIAMLDEIIFKASVLKQHLLTPQTPTPPPPQPFSGPGEER